MINYSGYDTIICPHCGYNYDWEDVQYFRQHWDQQMFQEECVECGLSFSIDVEVDVRYRMTATTTSSTMEA